jgi:hypothetical protein
LDSWLIKGRMLWRHSGPFFARTLWRGSDYGTTRQA